jgi:hypothetical protein
MNGSFHNTILSNVSRATFLCPLPFSSDGIRASKQDYRDLVILRQKKCILKTLLSVS